jgi:hypothetical protein
MICVVNDSGSNGDLSLGCEVLSSLPKSPCKASGWFEGPGADSRDQLISRDIGSSGHANEGVHLGKTVQSR